MRSTWLQRASGVAAVGLLVAAAAAGLVPFHTGNSMNPSCGSVLIPNDTWSDCIADRSAFAVAVMLMDVLAVLLAAVMYLTWPRGTHASMSTTRHSGAWATCAAWIFLVLTVLALLAPAGSAHCGATLIHLGNGRPTDEGGNFDSVCTLRYQRLWVVAAVGATLAASSRAYAEAARRTPALRPPWVSAVLVATSVGAASELFVAMLGSSGLWANGGV